MNPKATIDSILDAEVSAGSIAVKPLTLARWALLEKVGSPIAFGSAEMKEG